MKWLRDFFLNRHEGQPSFGLQRLTGFLLAIYLMPHVFVNSYALLYGPAGYDKATQSVQRLSWLEVLIILGVAFHMFNGIRLISVDFFRSTRRRKMLFWVASAFTLIAFLYSLFYYLPEMISSR